MEKINNTIKLVSKTIISFFFIISISTIIFSTTNAASDITISDSTTHHELEEVDTDFQKIGQSMVSDGKGKASSKGWSGRILIGLESSSPPSCISKCGQCTPCTAVIVRVPPAPETIVDQYYLVQWKCTCGGKLYDP